MIAIFSFNGSRKRLNQATTREPTNFLTTTKLIKIMAIKVIVQRREMKIGKNPGKNIIRKKSAATGE